VAVKSGHQSEHCNVRLPPHTYARHQSRWRECQLLPLYAHDRRTGANHIEFACGDVAKNSDGISGPRWSGDVAGFISIVR
jgi:hypothetical protein